MKAKYAYPLLLLSGAVLSFAFPEPDIAPLAWFALVPLFVVARDETAGRGFLAGFVFGLGFFGPLLSWVSLIGWVAWGVLVPLQAVFIGLFGLAWAKASQSSRGPARAASAGRESAERVVAAASMWVAIEALRSLVPVGGFTWGQLAQSQHNLQWMLRPASIGGGLLVAFILVAVNACWAEAITSVPGRARAALVPAVTAAVLLVAPVLIPAQDATGEALDVAIVQGNVPTEIPVGFERDMKILESHTELTRGLEGEGVDLVVWPESALPFDVDDDPEAQIALQIASGAAGAPILAGGNLDVDDEHYKVMAFQVDKDGRIVDRYQKTHLVPFGEYVPGRNLFGWIPMLDQVARDAVAGENVAVFDVAGGKVAPVISFEADFGSLVRRRMDEGARLLTVLTNTSTWGRTWASAQHVAFSQVRAAENGVWVVHAALSGISAFIAPDGQVVERLPLWTADSAVAEVRFAEDTTFYARTGDWLPWLATVLSAAALFLSWRRCREPAS